MKKLYLSYEEDSREEYSGDADFQYQTRYKNVQFTGVAKESIGFFGHDFEVSDDLFEAQEIFLVIPRYQDGGSFGTTHGQWEVWAAVGTEEEALKIEADIRSGALSKKGAYLPWVGYFASLEDVEVHCFRVGRKSGVRYH